MLYVKNRCIVIKIRLFYPILPLCSPNRCLGTKDCFFFYSKNHKNHPSVFVIGSINLHLKLMTIINTKQENTTLNITNPKTKPKLEDKLFKYENGYHSFVESLYIRKLYTGIYRSYEHQNQEHIPIGCVVVT